VSGRFVGLASRALEQLVSADLWRATVG